MNPDASANPLCGKDQAKDSPLEPSGACEEENKQGDDSKKVDGHRNESADPMDDELKRGQPESFVNKPVEETMDGIGPLSKLEEGGHPDGSSNKTSHELVDDSQRHPLSYRSQSFELNNPENLAEKNQSSPSNKPSSTNREDLDSAPISSQHDEDAIDRSELQLIKREMSIEL